jgi:hypothetical protein
VIAASFQCQRALLDRELVETFQSQWARVIPREEASLSLVLPRLEMMAEQCLRRPALLLLRAQEAMGPLWLALRALGLAQRRR